MLKNGIQTHVNLPLFKMPDSSHILPSDVFFRENNILVDSLSAANDSTVFAADSITSLINSSGFTGILNVSLPQNESWVVLFLLCVFFLTALIFGKYGNLIFENFDAFFQIKRRQSIFNISTQGEEHYRYLLLFLSFSMLSFYMYLQLWDGNSPFSFKIYLILLGLTLFYVLIKAILTRLIAYVFLSFESFNAAKFSYNWIIIYLASILFFAALIQIFSDFSQKIVFLAGISICAIASIIYIIKLFQNFYTKKIVSFYIMLYLCTLEILPLLFLLKGCNTIIQSVPF